MRNLSKADVEMLQDAVKKAELATSGEIVPMVVAKSANYMGFHFFAGLLGLVLASIAGIFWQEQNPWWSLPNFVLWQVLGFTAGFLMSEIPFLQRALISTKVFESETAKNAYANFLALGLGHLKDRNGVLIHVSVLERKIHILADEGIHDIVGNDFWNAQTNLIAKGLREHRSAEGLKASITHIGAKLAEHFPHHEGDQNHFGDKVRDKSLV